MGTPHPAGLTSQHVDLSGIADDPAFAQAVMLGENANAALEAWRESRATSDLNTWRRARDAYGSEVAYWRTLGEQMGTRVTADVVSYLDADGAPDTSTAAGVDYWADVAQAAELGVPNTFGTQR